MVSRSTQNTNLSYKIPSFPKIGGVRYRRWSVASATADGDMRHTNTSDSNPHLSLYADTVIGEEVLDQKYEV